MNILFYKLLAIKELEEQAKYLLTANDFDNALENQIRSSGYNSIEKLKELRDDLDAQLLTPEIVQILNSKYKSTTSLNDRIEWFDKLDKAVNERFKFYGLFITTAIYDYLSTKELKETK